jgi:hypothetical protein
MQKTLKFEQLTSKVRNLLFSKIFPFFPKKNENSKFRTLLVSCSNLSVFCILLLRPEFYYVRQTATQKFTMSAVRAAVSASKKTEKNPVFYRKNAL